MTPFKGMRAWKPLPYDSLKASLSPPVGGRLHSFRRDMCTCSCPFTTAMYDDTALFLSAGIIPFWSARQPTLQCTVVHLQLLPIYCYPEQHCSLTLSILFYSFILQHCNAQMCICSYILQLTFRVVFLHPVHCLYIIHNNFTKNTYILIVK